MKLLLAAFAVAIIFGASVPASCFMFGPRIMKQINRGGPNGNHGMGGRGGGGGPYEPLDFEGVFTRSMRKLQRQVLKHANRYRRMHGVRALKEDEKDACPSSPGTTRSNCTTTTSRVSVPARATSRSSCGRTVDV
uniref:Antigen 5 family member n=1 Tax=Rhipicephalus appendiculatus TaxID=34631 RepID=A0A131Z544_RHIAP